MNLHPDQVRGRLYTVNYQQPGLIPRCAPVRFVETGATREIFELASNGGRYLYIRHSSLREPLERHLGRYFGTNCDKNNVTSLSEVDRDGITRRKALVGMTKEAVTLASATRPSMPPRVWKPMSGRTGKATCGHSRSSS